MSLAGTVIVAFVVSLVVNGCVLFAGVVFARRAVRRMMGPALGSFNITNSTVPLAQPTTGNDVRSPFGA